MSGPEDVLACGMVTQECSQHFWRDSRQVILPDIYAGKTRFFFRHSFALIAIGKALIGIFGPNASKPPCTKEACPLLTEHRGREIAQSKDK